MWALIFIVGPQGRDRGAVSMWASRASVTSNRDGVLCFNRAADRPNKYAGCRGCCPFEPILPILPHRMIKKHNRLGPRAGPTGLLIVLGGEDRWIQLMNKRGNP